MQIRSFGKGLSEYGSRKLLDGIQGSGAKVQHFDARTYGRMFDDKTVKTPTFYCLLGARKVQQAACLKDHLEGNFMEAAFRVVKHAWRNLDNPLGTLRISVGKCSTGWLVAKY